MGKPQQTFFKGPIYTEEGKLLTTGDLPAGTVPTATIIQGDYANAPSNAAVYDALQNVGGAVSSVNGDTGAVVLDKADIGLSNVDNTSDADKPLATSTQTALAGKANTSHTHALSDLTQSGATSSQVVTWNGTAWVPSTPAAGVTDHTLLTNIGTNTHAQIDSHLSSTSNPHSVTKAQVGLGSVDNTADADKPVSTATTTALALKSDKSAAANSLRGNNTGVTANAIDLTPTQATAMLDVMVSPTPSTAGVKGLVPAAAAKDILKNKFLKADGTFSALTKDKSPQKEAVSALATFSAGTGVPANQWFGVCYSPELNLFCAIASSGTNRVALSKDGENWKDYPVPGTADVWTKICWSPQLKIFCAVSYYNECMTSPDGINWTVRVITTGAWYDICWSPELGLFCAVSASGSGTGISTSPDGITWTAQTVSGYINAFYSVCWSPELSLFCAVRSVGPAFTSPDGINWTQQTIASSSTFSSVCWSPGLGLFCAVGITLTNRCSTSPDGVTWTQQAIGANLWRQVIWSDALAVFIAVASGGQISYSFDGVTWIAGTNPQASNSWYGICAATQPGLIVITGTTGTARIMSSKRVRMLDMGFNPDAKNLPIARSGTTITLGLVDANSTTRFTAVTAVTLTIPADATTYFKIGTKMKFIQQAAGAITLTPAAGVTLVGKAATFTSNGLYSVMELEKIDVNTWILSGDAV